MRPRAAVSGSQQKSAVLGRQLNFVLRFKLRHLAFRQTRIQTVLVNVRAKQFTFYIGGSQLLQLVCDAVEPFVESWFHIEYSMFNFH